MHRPSLWDICAVLPCGTGPQPYENHIFLMPPGCLSLGFFLSFFYLWVILSAVFPDWYSEKHVLLNSAVNMVRIAKVIIKHVFWNLMISAACFSEGLWIWSYSLEEEDSFLINFSVQQCGELCKSLDNAALKNCWFVIMRFSFPLKIWGRVLPWLNERHSGNHCLDMIV